MFSFGSPSSDPTPTSSVRNQSRSRLTQSAGWYVGAYGVNEKIHDRTGPMRGTNSDALMKPASFLNAVCVIGARNSILAAASSLHSTQRENARTRVTARERERKNTCWTVSDGEGGRTSGGGENQREVIRDWD